MRSAARAAATEGRRDAAYARRNERLLRGADAVQSACTARPDEHGRWVAQQPGASPSEEEEAARRRAEAAGRQLWSVEAPLWDELEVLFAGADREATDHARLRFLGTPHKTVTGKWEMPADTGGIT